MNAQRWIAVGVTTLIIACIATSGVWLELLRSADDEDATTEATPDSAAEDNAGVSEDQNDTSEQPEATEATPTPFLFGDTTGDEMMEEEVDPLVAELLAALQQESLDIGEDPYITRAGDFTTIDAIRRGEGLASVYQIGESRRVLRLDPFNVSTGPDLRVLLSENEMPRTGADALNPTYVDLGALQSVSGSQNYEIPEDIDFDKYNSVVIYSLSLNIIYTTAPLEQVRGQ